MVVKAKENPFAPKKVDLEYLQTFSKAITNKYFTAAFGWESAKGFKYSANQACHAAMSYGVTYQYGFETLGEFDGTKIERVLNGVPLRRDTKDYDPMTTAYMEWAVYHSPYKDAFLSDDQAVLHDLHVTIGNPEKPANFMTGGLMLSRYIWEHPAVSAMWFKLVEEGLHPDIAFLVAHRYYVDGNNIVHEHNPVHTGCMSGQNLTSLPYVLNFLQRKLFNLGKPYVQRQEGATNTFRLWTGENDTLKGQVSPFSKALPALMTKLATPVAKTANVFAKAKAADEPAKKVKFKEAAPAIVELFEPYKEYINA